MIFANVTDALRNPFYNNKCKKTEHKKFSYRFNLGWKMCNVMKFCISLMQNL